MEKEKVVFTGEIPQCPHCKKPTKRTGGGAMVTLKYYPPVYDENGLNTNPDRNTRTSYWECLECKKTYGISGNWTDGFVYLLPKPDQVTGNHEKTPDIMPGDNPFTGGAVSSSVNFNIDSNKSS